MEVPRPLLEIGPGFVESVYQPALLVELCQALLVNFSTDRADFRPMEL
jgi:hypothetical protein